MGSKIAGLVIATAMIDVCPAVRLCVNVPISPRKVLPQATLHARIIQAMRMFWRMSFWLLVLATLWLSLIPVDQVPKAFSFWDKAQHALGFAVLGFLGLMTYSGHVGKLLLSLGLFGIGIEVAQWLTGWRYGDWQDWIADCVGLVIGWVTWRLLRPPPR